MAAKVTKVSDKERARLKGELEGEYLDRDGGRYSGGARDFAQRNRAAAAFADNEIDGLVSFIEDTTGENGEHPDTRMHFPALRALQAAAAAASKTPAKGSKPVTK